MQHDESVRMWAEQSLTGQMAAHAMGSKVRPRQMSGQVQREVSCIFDMASYWEKEQK